MKKRRQKAASRQLDVDDLVALVGALNSIRNGSHSSTSLTDPSLNVKELVELRANYEEKIRVLNSEWQARYDSERRASVQAQQVAESGRIDAQLLAIQRNAEVTAERLSDAATALATTVAATADAAQKAVAAASSAQTELVTQVRETVQLVQTQVTQLIAGGAGSASQRTENRQLNMWAIGIVIGLLVVVGNYVASHFK